MTINLALPWVLFWITILGVLVTTGLLVGAYQWWQHKASPPKVRAELREIFARLRADRLFHAVMATTSDAIIVSDQWGHLLAISTAAQRLFGYEEREILGLPITLLMPLRYREQHSQAIERTWRTGEYLLLGQMVHGHGLHKSGAEFPIVIELKHETIDGTVFLLAYIRVRDEA